MSNWNIKKLKKERSKLTKRTQIGLNNLKQRQRLIALNNKRKGIMSNREKENHEKYIKKTLKDINYDRYVSVEVFDFSPDPQTIAAGSLHYLKGIESGLP